jgi:hypothetical protein
VRVRTTFSGLCGSDVKQILLNGSRFPLEQWDEAVLALKDAARTGAVKVLLEPC